ncbi:Crp/Fnr family transcriptional regulator [Actinocorallia aurantiaca]
MVGRTGPWPPASVMAALRPEEREALLSSGTEIEFPPDSHLVRQGEPAGELFVLLDGYVKVVMTTPEGIPAIMAVRARGDLIGEFAVLDGGRRTASVITVDTVIAIRISVRRYREFDDRFPGATRRFYDGVLGKMRATMERRIQARAWDARTRLAKTLHELAVTHGVPAEEGVEIPLPLSQFELGSLAGASEATTERHLHEFRALGLVRTHYRKIVVLDLDGLGALWEGS